jgi:intracellular septation protein
MRSPPSPRFAGRGTIAARTRISLASDPGYIHAMTDTTQRKQLNPLLKLALEIGPLLLFFLAYSRPALFLPVIGPMLPASIGVEKAGIFVATAVFIIAILVSLAVSYALTRHLPLMGIVTAVVVVVFGGMTLVLHDDRFIKMKPTIIYTLFGGVLLGGLWFNKSFLAIVFDSVFDLTEEGWRKLTFRWGIFFLALAVLNEIVWQTQTEAFWVNFKVFGVVPLTFAFAAFQYPLLQKYSTAKDEQ